MVLTIVAIRAAVERPSLFEELLGPAEDGEVAWSSEALCLGGSRSCRLRGDSELHHGIDTGRSGVETGNGDG